MNGESRSIPAALLALALLPLNVSAANDVLRFLDGSLLHGMLLSVDAEHEVRWQHPGARQTLEFSRTNLQEIRFGGARPVVTNSAAKCRIFFHNGDEVLSDTFALNHDSLEVDTTFAGRLHAPRATVRAISVASRGLAAIYDSTENTNGWRISGNAAIVGGERVVLGGGLINFDPAVFNARVLPQNDERSKTSPAWIARDGAFYSGASGTLARDVPLPAQSRIAFDFAWKGLPSLRFSFYTDSLDTFSYTSGYQFYFSNTSIYMVRRANERVAQSSSASVRLPLMNQRNRLHFEFRCDNEKGTVAMYIDDVFMQEWKDSNAPMLGGGLAFYSQRNDLAVRISNVKVWPWDGRTDEPLPTNALAETTLLLANGDRISGALERLHEDHLELTTAAAKLVIPLLRVRQIFLSTPTNSPSEKFANEAVFHLPDGEKMSFALEQWAPEKITGKSAVFGVLKLHSRAVRQFLFNPALPRTEADVFVFPGDDRLGN